MRSRLSSVILALVATLLLSANGSTLSAAEAHSTNSSVALEMKKFQLAPGLKIELVAAEPLLSNPVCFSIDSRGRFFVVETHRYRKSILDITANTPWLLDDLSLRTVNDRAAFLARNFATNFSTLTNDSELIRLLDDRDGDGRAETSSIFAEGFNQSVSGTAAGVLAQGTNVWLACIPDLWRFSGGVISGSVISNQSDAAASRQLNTDSLITDLLTTGLGVHISVSGHDVHGLIRGPDGRLYFSFGDRGVCVTNREGVVLNVPDTGGVLRCEPDGRDLEIFCSGLRNPQELAFDDLGNLWTVDNDTAGADPCRVLHLIKGGDYGWRGSYQHMKGFGPWVQEELWRGGLDGVLPPAGTVSQGPAGLAFYPGTSAVPQLAGKFVHADFPGGVWAYDVKPRGASYEVAGREKILWNCWPTDVDFGPDGALYVLDWVQGWAPPGKGRIYRLTANDQSPMSNAQLDVVRQTRQFLAEGMGRRSEKELLSLLGHADRRVRLEAQWELAAHGTNSLLPLVRASLEDKRPLARIHALWAFRQIIRQQPRSVGAAELAALLPLLEDSHAEIRGQAALALGEGRLFNAERPVAKLLEDSSPRTRLLALQAVNLRWHDEFTGGVRVPRDRVHFSNYQRAAGAAATKLEKALGAEPWTISDKMGATITGHFPLNKIAGVFPANTGEAFFQSAATHLLANTWTPQGAFHSWFPKSASAEARAAAVLTCRRLTNGLAASFLRDDSPRVVLEAVRSVNDVGIATAYPALAELLDDPRFRDANWGWSALSNITPAGPFSANVRSPREQVLRRALNAHFRLGAATNAAALVRFALNDSMPEALRAEALFLLGAWEVLPAKVGDLPIKPAKDPNHGSVPTVNPENWPGWFDRIVGLWRPLPPRPASEAQRALAPQIAVLLSDASPEVAQAALDAATRLRLAAAAPVLLARLRDPAAPGEFRGKVPAALAVVDGSRLGEAVKVALADADLAVRASALPYLDRLEDDEAAKILGEIVASYTVAVPDGAGKLRLAQAALVALGRLKPPAGLAALRAAARRLADGSLPPALELDVLEATAGTADPEVLPLLARRAAALPEDDALASWRPSLIGGDALRGRELFFQKAEVQCSRCHIIKGEGGNLGPALDRIARTRSREYLLEAMIQPNKVIAPGFENVMVTMKNGATYAGLVKGETDTELQLESPEYGSLKLAKADMVSRQRGLSAMPEDLKQFLTPREVRDLVEYLASLK